MEIKEKFYYHFTELFFLKREANKGFKKDLQKRLFLYFDYEREFSGFKTEMTNDDVIRLIDILEKYNFKGTWFTVGKVIENYFPTIKYLLEKNHEIGSHTFSHLSPFEISKQELLNDFFEFEKTKNKFNLEIKGFHSPKNKWNLVLFENLTSFKYSYDVYHPAQKRNVLGNEFENVNFNQIKRLISLGDDWDVYNKSKTREEVLEYFKSLYSQLKPGKIRGIGVHPWVLYSDINIFLGYTDFLEFLANQSDLIIKPAIEFLNDRVESEDSIKAHLQN